MRKRIESVEEEKEEMALQQKASRLKAQQMERQMNALQEDNERLQSQVEQEEEQEVFEQEQEVQRKPPSKLKKQKTLFQQMGADDYIMYLKELSKYIVPSPRIIVLCNVGCDRVWTYTAFEGASGWIVGVGFVINRN